MGYEMLGTWYCMRVALKNTPSSNVCTEIETLKGPLPASVWAATAALYNVYGLTESKI